LPARTRQGAVVTWRTKTKKVCSVVTNKSKVKTKVKGKKKGKCVLKASAPAISGYTAFSQAFKVKVR
jgi:hypothetical protein